MQNLMESETCEIVLPRKKERVSNFELLRIICMALIIMHHYAVHGGFWFGTEVTFNRIAVQFFSAWGKLGVNCFVLISGYFLCEQTTFRWQRACKILLQVTVFSLVIFVIFVIKGSIAFSLKELIKCLLPLLFGDWWFAGCYFALMLIAPFLSKGLQALDKKSHLTLIAILTIIWCVLPTVFNRALQSSNLLWFVYLYVLAAYIKMYPNKITDNQRVCAISFVASTSFVILSFVLYDYLGKFEVLFSDYATFYVGMDKLPMVVCSLSLFCLFKNGKKFTNKVVNSLASVMFGVYLMHDHPMTRHYLWIELFKNYTYNDSPWLILHATVTVIIVFVVGIAVSYLYKYAIDLPFDKLLGVLSNKKSIKQTTATQQEQLADINNTADQPCNETPAEE